MSSSQRQGLFSTLEHGRGESGFTLVELIVTLVIVVILAAVAVPSFTRLIEDRRVASQSMAMRTALALARSEALKRGVPVAVSATGANLSDGWCVRLQPGGCDVPADVIRVFGGSPRVRVETVPQTDMVAFDRRGGRMLPANDVTFRVRPEDGCEAGVLVQRNIEVGLSGRLAVRRSDCP